MKLNEMRNTLTLQELFFQIFQNGENASKIQKKFISFFHVLTCITSFRCLSIPCNAFIACYK